MKIKFLQYNIAGCRNFEVEGINPVKTDKTIQKIKSFNADIITINEIDKNVERSFKVDQPGLIAEALGYNYYFAPTIEIGGGLYGIALFTKFKIEHVKVIKIPDRPMHDEFEPRVIISAVLDICGTKTGVLMSHFGLSAEERESAIQTVCLELENMDIPTIFSGDLNMTPDDPILKKLPKNLYDTANMLEKDAVTFKGIHMSKYKCIKIDYVFTKGNINTTQVKVQDTYVSDHRPYYCEFEL